MRDASTGAGRARAFGAMLVLGWFGMGKKKDGRGEGASARPAEPRLRVVLEGMNGTQQATVPAPAAATPGSLNDAVRYKALHGDIDPTLSVRVSQMTCPNCSRSFRYFLNSDGKKTPVKCPECGRQFRL